MRAQRPSSLERDRQRRGHGDVHGEQVQRVARHQQVGEARPGADQLTPDAREVELQRQRGEDQPGDEEEAGHDEQEARLVRVMTERLPRGVSYTGGRLGSLPE